MDGSEHLYGTCHVQAMFWQARLGQDGARAVALGPTGRGVSGAVGPVAARSRAVPVRRPPPSGLAGAVGSLASVLSCDC